RYNWGKNIFFKNTFIKEYSHGKTALAQINEKKYDTSMKNNGVSKVIKIGMAFSGKDMAIESEVGY
ncbi:PD-(D/E)XK nuclease domain-containing protein, partial [Cetobacterium sp.]|uniref:PD-(D/E)XK nuclease domain-containing protein n=1 Tax=Cetobacterium sp. TaxID=2071632 RepID=UPI003EE70321